MRHAREDYQRIQDPAGLIPQDEPVFLIRGRDLAGPAAVRAWAKIAEDIGAGADIVTLAELWAREMERYQAKHPELAQIPDLPPEES